MSAIHLFTLGQFTEDGAWESLMPRFANGEEMLLSGFPLKSTGAEILEMLERVYSGSFKVVQEECGQSVYIPYDVFLLCVALLKKSKKELVSNLMCEEDFDFCMGALLDMNTVATAVFDSQIPVVGHCGDAVVKIESFF